MDLSFPGSSQQVLNAMDMEASQGKPLSDHVIHTRADIRITGIESASLDGQRLVTTKASREDVQHQERAAQMQSWWDSEITKAMDLPDGYQHVAVLLIKWTDELDELDTREEAEELEAVFRDQFHYATKIVELNVSSKPQLQLNSFIADFVQKNDGPNTLMIIYYTGHGKWQMNQEYLELIANITPTSRYYNKDASANWNKIEQTLRSDDIEGDILTILDTCYSSNLAKSGTEDTRTFELLSACTPDATTSKPGPHSFTRALISALRELLAKHGAFSTFFLNQCINTNPSRREQQSQLWFRLHNHERNIRLTPLTPELQRNKGKKVWPQPKGYLTLRLGLNADQLREEQIKLLTRNVARVFNNGKSLVRKIDWLGLRPARVTHFERTALVLYVLRKWRNFVRRQREKRRAEEREGRTVDEVDVGMGGESEQQEVSLSPTRKRTREFEDAGPSAKRERELLVISPHLPSPPVSDRAEEGGVDVE
ncbi:hypothetical protein EJ04DRAFT_303169 [Polyplosphaeria fusca]|uniref:Caspase domain-containing protein n=1 Tax=Polyplosphaeria fusca TaxID=682080 RepID=A0A9P4QX74_9PLEO|nr:hypothetical protein EJ04DRAFT_303169 [Polyplosphaeria fusca]